MRFAQVARERGARPVILHLPGYGEMAEHRERGQEPIASVETRAICERNGLDCILPLLDEPVEPMRERWDYFVRGQGGGHYSARGHRWIADVLAVHLRELAPELVASTAHAARPAEG